MRINLKLSDEMTGVAYVNSVELSGVSSYYGFGVVETVNFTGESRDSSVNLLFGTGGDLLFDEGSKNNTFSTDGFVAGDVSVDGAGQTVNVEKFVSGETSIAGSGHNISLGEARGNTTMSSQNVELSIDNAHLTRFDLTQEAMDNVLDLNGSVVVYDNGINTTADLGWGNALVSANGTGITELDGGSGYDFVVVDGEVVILKNFESFSHIGGDLTVDRLISGTTFIDDERVWLQHLNAEAWINIDGDAYIATDNGSVTVIGAFDSMADFLVA